MGEDSGGDEIAAHGPKTFFSKNPYGSCSPLIRSVAALNRVCSPYLPGGRLIQPRHPVLQPWNRGPPPVVVSRVQTRASLLPQDLISELMRRHCTGLTQTLPPLTHRLHRALNPHLHCDIVLGPDITGQTTILQRDAIGIDKVNRLGPLMVHDVRDWHPLGQQLLTLRC